MEAERPQRRANQDMDEEVGERPGLGMRRLMPNHRATGRGVGFLQSLRDYRVRNTIITAVRNAGFNQEESATFGARFKRALAALQVDTNLNYRHVDIVKGQLVDQALYDTFYADRANERIVPIWEAIKNRLADHWGQGVLDRLFGNRLADIPATNAQYLAFMERLNNPQRWDEARGSIVPVTIWPRLLRDADHRVIQRFVRAGIPEPEFAAALDENINVEALPDRVFQNAPVPRLPANFSGVGLLGNIDHMGGYTNYQTTVGGIPVAARFPPAFQERIVSDEINSIPSKPINTLKINEQFGDIINQITEKIDGELYKKQEMLVSYKSRIIMAVFDSLRNALKGQKVTSPASRYVFSRFYNVYRMGPTFGQAVLYPIHLKIKFDKDANPIGDDPTDSGFGVYLGKIEEDARVYKMIPFGKKKRAEYEFKVAPYFGYVNSIFGVLKNMVPMDVPQMSVHTYGREESELPASAEDVNSVSLKRLNIQTVGADISDYSKFSAWVASTKEDNRPLTLAIRKFNSEIGRIIATFPGGPDMQVVNQNILDYLEESCNQVAHAIGTYYHMEVDRDVFYSLFRGVTNAMFIPTLHQVLSLVPQLLVSSAPNPGDVFLERIIKVNDANGEAQSFNTIGGLSQYLTNRLQAGGDEVADYIISRQMAGSFLYIPHHLLTNRASDVQMAATAGVEANRITSHFRRKYEALPATVMCSGFPSLGLFAQYIMLMGWIRNFIYALKQERTKISRQRITKYVKADSKNLEKLIYTFGGEPSKFIGR